MNIDIARADTNTYTLVLFEGKGSNDLNIVVNVARGKIHNLRRCSFDLDTCVPRRLNHANDIEAIETFQETGEFGSVIVSLETPMRVDHAHGEGDILVVFHNHVLCCLSNNRPQTVTVAMMGFATLLALLVLGHF